MAVGFRVIGFILSFLSTGAFAAEKYPAVDEGSSDEPTLQWVEPQKVPAGGPPQMEIEYFESPKAYRAHKKRRAKPSETKPANAPVAKPGKPSKAVAKTPAPAPQPTVVVLQPPSDTRSGDPISKTFDPVPSDQIPSLVGRMRLAEKIMVRYGRAYDYRLHTTSDLKSILTRLEDAQKNPTQTEQN